MRGKKLARDIIMAKYRTDNIQMIRELNLWGNNLSDVTLLKEMKNIEVLILTINQISSLEDFGYCPKLKQLYLRENLISNVTDVIHLQKLQYLKKLILKGNPCTTQSNYRLSIIKLLPQLEFLDEKAITYKEREASINIEILQIQNFSKRNELSKYNTPSQYSEQNNNNIHNYDQDNQNEMNNELEFGFNEKVDISMTINNGRYILDTIILSSNILMIS